MSKHKGCGYFLIYSERLVKMYGGLKIIIDRTPYDLEYIKKAIEFYKKYAKK